MKFLGALVKEQGVTFAIVVVKKYVIDSITATEKSMMTFARVFDGVPIVCMALNSQLVPVYRGRRDIVNFLSNVHISQIPWREYSVN